MKSIDYHKATDENLAGLLQKGDNRAFDEIFNRYWEKLFKATDNILMNEASAKDIVQVVFINIWERRNQLIISNLHAYLRQATKYQVASALRRGQVTEKHLDHLAAMAQHQESDTNNIDQMINYEELNSAILSSLDQVSDRCKEVFYLSRFEDLSNEEIATQLGISIRTVETHISKALKHLRFSLRDTVSIIAMILILSK